MCDGQTNMWDGQTNMWDGQTNMCDGQTNICDGQTNICDGQTNIYPILKKVSKIFFVSNHTQTVFLELPGSWWIHRCT